MENQNRQIVFDTETTGMNQKGGPIFQGHKVIEIGCVELINRKHTGNHFHVYINPLMEVDPDAFKVHGISNEFLADKPVFADIASDFLAFIRGAELIAHNANFDISFIDHEFSKLAQSPGPVQSFCSVTDTLKIAKDLYPGQKNNLDALCRRLGIDNSHRELHGALLDAQILADVYLLMTGGQTKLNLHSGQSGNNDTDEQGRIRRLPAQRSPLKIIAASADEIKEHEARLDLISQEGDVLWRQQ